MPTKGDEGQSQLAMNDALSALVNLGYARAEAWAVLRDMIQVMLIWIVRILARLSKKLGIRRSVAR